MSESLDLAKLKAYQRAFIKDRDWAKFHSPKNLVMALAGEAGELCEIFQWMQEEETFTVKEGHAKHEDLRDELADILYYLVRIADVLDVDLNAALWNKTKKNEKKYPVDLARGNAKKYTEF